MLRKYIYLTQILAVSATYTQLTLKTKYIYIHTNMNEVH